ncbi:PTS sugar transporter subunit IIA [Lactobacillus sp. ESL0681]|uniref:PTS sugar transporter subunit IIA n=1 Tax=Lactobacillus sp. ESL0681 TaxID=2983211 RepID=UPI0023F61D3B|nr:PTS sugar transporter subunit IIA [Lactobacillus sp. ESL0681]WEV39997.1 PTS sugar transporter subunit IIA [Lactobacillus sp. ESL0681]
MRYLILVSHGRLAEGMKTALEMFSGDATDQSYALCLHKEMTAADLKHATEEFLKKQNFAKNDRFIILADIIGGSPLTTVLDVFSNYGFLQQSTVVGGMNFSMALNVIINLNLNILSEEELVNKVLSEGQAAIKQYEPEAETADEDDI